MLDLWECRVFLYRHCSQILIRVGRYDMIGQIELNRLLTLK